MPVIARFFGMVIKMYFLGKEHGIAHIHVIYGEYAGVIDISTGEMIEGDLPFRALGMVREWIEMHKDDLLEMWAYPKHSPVAAAGVSEVYYVA